MSRQKELVEKSKKEFLKRRVMNLAELLELFGCSVRTMQRHLHAWQALSSYNHNGRYYTLPEVPRFNPHGIWSYHGRSFSRYGSLKKTLIQLIKNSANGLSSTEIGELLGVNPRSFLSHFQGHPELYRERIGRRYIWFSADANIRNRQKCARIDFEEQISAAMLAPEDAIKILVDLLHHPGSTIEAICRRLGRKPGVKLTTDNVRAFLAMHDLLKKTTR